MDLRRLSSTRLRNSSRPFPVQNKNTLKDAPEGVDKALCMRQVRYFTSARIRLDSPEFSLRTLDEGRPDRRRQARKLKYMISLQRELLLHEHWDGTPRFIAPEPCLIPIYAPPVKLSN